MLGIAPQARGEMPQERGHQQTPTSQPSPGQSEGFRGGSGVRDSGAFRQSPSPAGIVPPNRQSGHQRPSTEPGPLPSPIRQRLPPGTGSVVFNRPFAPCKTMPDQAFWRRRNHDVFDFILRSSRSAFIPVVPFPDGSDHLEGTSIVGIGWRAYGLFVPPGGRVRATLNHPNKGWFSLYLVNKWGSRMEGTRRRLGEPELTYENGSTEVKAIYVVVDDPGLWATEGSPYTLTLNRSFDPKQVAVPELKIAQGIWN